MCAAGNQLQIESTFVGRLYESKLCNPRQGRWWYEAGILETLLLIGPGIYLRTFVIIENCADMLITPSLLPHDARVPLNNLTICFHESPIQRHEGPSRQCHNMGSSSYDRFQCGRTTGDETSLVQEADPWRSPDRFVLGFWHRSKYRRISGGRIRVREALQRGLWHRGWWDYESEVFVHHIMAWRWHLW